MLFSRSLLVAALVVTVPCAALAEEIAVSGDTQRFKDLLVQQENHQEALLAEDAGLTVQFTSEQFGLIVANFTGVQSRDWSATFTDGTTEVEDTSAVVLMKGKASVGTHEVPAAGSVYRVNGRPELHVHLIVPGTPATPVEGVVSLEGATVGGELVTAPPALLEGKRCGDESFGEVTAPSAPPMVSSQVTAAAALRNIDIATDADYQFFQTHGSSTNAYIASTINAANVIYERDLSLHFNIHRQRVRTSSSQPFTSTNSSALLDQLRSSYNSDAGLDGADVVHLFTGKDVDSNVVGLAWVGVICQASSYSYGLTQNVHSSIDYLIFAHELGHNFGAGHDSALPGSLMYPMADTDHDFFSTTSKNQINSYLAAGDSCLSSGGDSDPAPTPTPLPTPDPRDDDGADPGIGFTAKFDTRTGKFTAKVTHTGISSGTCTFQLGIASKANLSDAIGLTQAGSAASKTFTATTSRRLSSSNGKVYFFGSVGPCTDNEGTFYSATKTLKPKSARSTRQGQGSFVDPVARAKDARAVGGRQSPIDVTST